MAIDETIAALDALFEADRSRRGALRAQLEAHRAQLDGLNVSLEDAGTPQRPREAPGQRHDTLPREPVLLPSDYLPAAKKPFGRQVREKLRAQAMRELGL